MLFVLPSSLNVVSIEDTNTIYVDDDGGADYRKIQDAIDNATDGDTIFVYKGIYRENLNLNKAVILEGEDKNDTVIDGRNTGIVIGVIVDSVSISNFKIQNSGEIGSPEYNSAIKLHSSHNKIYENIITNNNIGIFLKSSSNNMIHNNIILDNLDEAFRIEDSSNNVISENHIFNNDAGMFIDSTPHGFNPISSNNTIIKNNISNNRLGILIRSTSHCNITNNIIQGNNDAISVQDSSNIIISDNILKENKWSGISVIDSTNSFIQTNTIKNNKSGIVLVYSSYTTINNNNFSLNGIEIIGNKKWQWDTHIIQNNTVNSKKIRYYTNQNNITIPVEDTGQIILGCCTNINIKNQNLSYIDTAVQLGYCSNVHIFNNSIFSIDGISLQFSDNNTIEKNNISSFQFGIFLDKSKHNMISKNIITDYDYPVEDTSFSSGIQLDYSHENNISGNTIYNFSQGIHLYAPSTNNTIYDNIIKNCTCEGLMLYSYSSNNTITKNIISGNEIGMTIWSSSNIIRNNIVSFNNDGILLEVVQDNIIAGNDVKKNEHFGLYLEKANSNDILSNNFILNGVQSYFKECTNNTWCCNYWNRPRYLPYLIIGRNNLRLSLRVDWHPAKRPYDIDI